MIIAFESGTTNHKSVPFAAGEEAGLSKYSMILGEQPQTICKEEVIRKLGNVSDTTQRNNVNKVCFNTFFFGEEINWEEVFA